MRIIDFNDNKPGKHSDRKEALQFFALAALGIFALGLIEITF